MLKSPASLLLLQHQQPLFVATHKAPCRSSLLEEIRGNDSPTCCDWMDAGVIAVVGFTPWLLEGNVRLLPLSVVGENLRNDLQMIHEATIMVRRLLHFIYEPQLLICIIPLT